MVSSEEAFDPAYMSAMFEYGYKRAINGDAWVDIGEEIEKGHRKRQAEAVEAAISR